MSFQWVHLTNVWHHPSVMPVVCVPEPAYCCGSRCKAWCFLLKNMYCQQAWERVPLSVVDTSVRNECYDLPMSASDHVWHHPSVVAVVCAPEPAYHCGSLRRPGGSEVRCKGKIRDQYWRMVSKVVRCTCWKVITLVPDRCDPYTQRYPFLSLLMKYTF